MSINSDLTDVMLSCTPSAIPAGPGRTRRYWVARSINTIRDQAALDVLQDDISSKACEAVGVEYKRLGIVDVTNDLLPIVRLTRLDDVRLIIAVEFSDKGLRLGQAGFVSQWGVLRWLDQEIRLEDLQGIPRECWLLFSDHFDEDSPE